MRKTLTVLGSVSLISAGFSNPIQAQASGEISQDLIDFAEEQKNLYEKSKGDVSPMYSRAWLQIAFSVADSAGDLLFDRQATTNRTSSSDSTSSGNISFNTSGYGSFATKDIDYQSTDHRMVAFAQTNPFGMWYRTIETMIQPLGGSGSPVQGSLTHNQQLDSEGGSLGDYQAVWNQSSNQTWDLWVTYWHWGDASAASQGFAYDDEGTEYNFIETENSIELIPSESHKNVIAQRSIVEPLSLEDLTNEVLDQEQGKFVSQFKNFNVGDDIHFEDQVVDITYNELEDATIFSFEDPQNESELIEFPFSSNLESEYTAGDTLSLTFEVVRIDENHDFETLDYLMMAIEDKNSIPSIEEFQ